MMFPMQSWIFIFIAVIRNPVICFEGTFMTDSIARNKKTSPSLRGMIVALAHLCRLATFFIILKKTADMGGFLFLLFGCMLNITGMAQKKNGSFELHIYRTSEPVRGDGIADEPVWKKAQVA